MKVAVIHNLLPGGARRRLEQQLHHLQEDVVEICLAGAASVTADPIVVAYRPLAARAPRAARPPLRYIDLAMLELAWQRVAGALRRVRADVVFANPCHLLQAPGALLATSSRSLYFCDEPRTPDGDPAVLAVRNSRTRSLYGPLYAAERRLDRWATLRATRIATNSHHTAEQIRLTYGRPAEVLPMGVPVGFTASFERPRHLLSVGSLTPDKSHDLVLRAAAAARSRWPVLIVAPRPDPTAEQALAALARSLAIPLTIRTAISDAELVHAYQAAQATLYLARAEPFGLASLEAQACGSPVIVAAEGGLPETIIPGATGWAVPRSPSAAAARLDELDGEDVRVRMTRAAAAHGAGASWQLATGALQRALHAVCPSWERPWRS